MGRAAARPSHLVATFKPRDIGLSYYS